MHAFLAEHAPLAAQRWPAPAMRRLREQVALDHPHLAHDFTTQRRMTLQHALHDVGADDALVERCFDAFIDARHQVELYPDVIDALQRLSQQRPLAAVTNGNADIQRIEVGPLFRFAISARGHGAAKPDPSIFLAACERFGLPPGEVLHVGDDPHLDVAGAATAGLRSCWINRAGARWPDALPPPDIEVTELHQLADWLDASSAAHPISEHRP